MDYSLGFGQPSPMGPQGGGPGYPPSQGGLPYPVAPLSAPGYPPSSGYPSSAPGYPSSQSNGYPSYPPQPSGAPGYPPAPSTMPGYPPVLNGSYGCPPPENFGYPSYPPQPSSTPGYPPQPSSTPGYPPQPSSTPGYPPQPSSTPGYPPQQSSTPGYPPQPSSAPAYPPQQTATPGYPPASSTAFGAGYTESAPSAPSAPGYSSSAPGYPPSTPYGRSSQPQSVASQPYPSLGSFYGNSSSSTSSFRATPTQQHAVERPTLRHCPNFDAGADAAALRKAMKGFGTDEAAIIRVLANRTSVQRQTIIMAYQQAYGKMLLSSLRSELSGDFERLVLAMMTPPAELLADHLHRAMAGLGTDEQTLVEILCTRSNQDIVSIKTAYQTKYRRPLQKDLEGDTSGHFRRLLVSMSTGARDEYNSNRQMAPQLAQQLYRAGEARMGTDESEFNRILASYSYPLLRAVFEEYRKIKGKSLHDAINSEFSGDIKNGLQAVVMSIENRPQFFAKCLHDSMAGLGTKDDTLVRIIVTRAEVDLGNIKQEYSRMYGRPIEKDIRGDTSGDYKKCLIALLQG